MIVGMVKGREPLIRLTICGFRGRRQEIEAVLDTGYTGWLTLPPTIIRSLHLPWRSFGRGTLAACVCLYIAHYNYCRMHGSLPGTPAMAARLAGHPWTMEELFDAE